jgi:hypothetical protein
MDAQSVSIIQPASSANNSSISTQRSVQLVKVLSEAVKNAWIIVPVICVKLAFTRRVTPAYLVHKKHKIVNPAVMHLYAVHVVRASISKIHHVLIAQNSLNSALAAI